ncbi:MAG: oxygenase MpaB family protein [Acidimicrobiales bacterium]
MRHLDRDREITAPSPWWRAPADRAVRRAIGLDRDPPPVCDDPAVAYLPVGGVARLVHGDLPAMLVGGVAALFFEMLHPYSMAGVADHSRYREDALGRVGQTAHFIAETTYGTRDTARAAVARVRAGHERVTGTADDGAAYAANDPHLLAWVHDAGTYAFWASYRRYGPRRLSAADADRYVDEMARLALDLGADAPPRSWRELTAQLSAFRPELRLSADGVEARDFLRAGVSAGTVAPAVYRLVVASALDLLPPWALALLDERPPSWRSAPVRLAMRGVGTALRAVIPPVAA